MPQIDRRIPIQHLFWAEERNAYADDGSKTCVMFIPSRRIIGEASYSPTVYSLPATLTDVASFLMRLTMRLRAFAVACGYSMGNVYVASTGIVRVQRSSLFSSCVGY